jgi:hypothetical protein
MTMHNPNRERFLPPPLHRVSGRGVVYNAHRILYRATPDDDWLVWGCYNIETLRDSVHACEALEHPDVHLVRQSHELPINPEDL